MKIELESQEEREAFEGITRDNNNRMIGAHQDHVRRLMEELAIARMCIRELGDRLSKLEKPWVDLIEEECFMLIAKNKDKPFDLFVAVQDKLREKNNG